MKTSYSVTYNPENKICTISMLGNINFSKILNIYIDIFQNKPVPDNCKKFLFADNDNEIEEGSPADIEKLHQFYTKNPQHFDGARIAYCIDNPQAHAIIFNARNKMLNPILRPFASVRRATEWLNLSDVKTTDTKVWEKYR
ncbi:MAG: hypothetical protein ACK5IJ_01600 [Mangrovibacterium sp.]